MTQTRRLPEWAINLKKFRKQEGFSQNSFGEKFGVTQQAVAYWESGKFEPPVEVLAWMVTVFTGTKEGQALLADAPGMNGESYGA